LLFVFGGLDEKGKVRAARNLKDTYKVTENGAVSIGSDGSINWWINGLGHITYLNKDRYIGECAYSGRGTGYGTYFYASGARYEGQWKYQKKMAKALTSTLTAIDM